MASTSHGGASATAWASIVRTGNMVIPMHIHKLSSGKRHVGVDDCEV